MEERTKRTGTTGGRYRSVVSNGLQAVGDARPQGMGPSTVGNSPLRVQLQWLLVTHHVCPRGDLWRGGPVPPFVTKVTPRGLSLPPSSPSPLARALGLRTQRGRPTLTGTPLLPPSFCCGGKPAWHHFCLHHLVSKCTLRTFLLFLGWIFGCRCGIFQSPIQIAIWTGWR